MKLSPLRIKQFQQYIFFWWRRHRRNLPWRRTHDPYDIWISEVMLQQTQVLRVIAKYSEFIEMYPNVYVLARASLADVLRLWKGMGYNRRALYLKRTAEIIINDHKGLFPKEEPILIKLPGLGTYTARAILVFAYKQNIACVDTNIRHIISHFFFKDKPQKEAVIQSVADQLLPAGKSWEWHQALMDYGAIELPKLNRPERSRRTSIPFKNSNRFFRGRIMDMLRESEKQEQMLIDDFVREYNLSVDFIQSILTGLEKDTLIVRKNDYVALPE